MKRFGKGMLLALLLLCTVLCSVGCTNYREQKPSEEDLQVVAQVGGFDVYYDELRYLVLNGMAQLESDHGEEIWSDAAKAEAHRAELVEFVESRLSEYYALLVLAQDYGYTLEALWNQLGKQVDEELETLLDEDLGGLGKMRKYKQSLEEAYLTDRYLRFSILMELAQEELFLTALTSGRIEGSSEKVREFILNDGFVRTLHVYVRNDVGDDAQANRAQAEAIRKELLPFDGTEAVFDEVCRAIGTYSEDTYMTTADGYYFAEGQMEEVYEAATFALPYYGVSDVVETYSGYYVIVRLPLDEDYVDKKLTTLIEDFRTAKFNGFLRQARAGLTVDWTAFGASLDLTAMQ
jgi:hypothetical protein